MQTEKKEDSFYIIDASSYIYRAFYALGRLTSPEGKATQAIYGFTQMLLKVLKEKKPGFICVVFDAPGPSFRHELYKDYKATRQQMPEELIEQIPYIKELVTLYGLPQLEMQGYEADDIIATLTANNINHVSRVVIVSGDKDLHQLVQDPVVIQWDPQRDRVFTEAEVKKRLGVSPSQVLDLLALMGDSSDHIPGIPGVGPKTAATLLRQWGNLENLYNHLDEVKGAALRRRLAEHRDLVLLSRSLVALRHDVPIITNIKHYKPKEPAWEDILRLYQKLGFKKFTESLYEQCGNHLQVVQSKPTKPSRKDHLVTSWEDLNKLIDKLKAGDCFSIDLETTSQNPMMAEIVGIAISLKDHESYYIPLAHTGSGSNQQLNRGSVIAALRPLLSGTKPGKVGQNLKYEWVVLKRKGINLKGISFDTMVASYLLEPGKHAHNLEMIASTYLGESMISYSEVTGKGKTQINFSQVDVRKAAEYACEDAEVTWRLVPVLKRRLQEENLYDLYESLELPLVSILAKMEYWGVLVDAEQLKELAIELEKSMEQRASAIYTMAGKEFNIQSPKQLGKVLYQDLGLPVIKRTKTGPSTDMSVLEMLAVEHPIAEQILAYRSLAKLKGTYADTLPRLIHPETGRIHTSFNQTVTATGRLSSSEPNLQNIPVRSEEGRRIRRAFISPPGHVLLSADYSQIELRVLAHYSQDQRLLRAFQEDADIHTITAAEMFGVAPHEVTAEMRRQAKTINFGIIYGMGPYGLARQLRVSTSTAKAAIDRYFARYQGVKRFIEEVIEDTGLRGYSRTLLGRKREIPELRSRNKTVRQQGERLAINTVIQGSAADLIKKAMIDIDRALEKAGINTKMVLQVHDELLFEVPESELILVEKTVKEKMEHVWPLSVPLKVDMGWGKNWAEAH